MSVAKKDYKRITTKSLIEMKANGEKISMLTAYDYTMAKIVDTAGIDVILVGDSASNVMAGHETTATALTWVWILLALHPDAARKVRAEVDSALEPDELPNFETLSKLKYTRQVFEETIRLYPPFWRFSRQALKDDQIPSPGKQHTIPAGTVMIISPYVIHRNEEYWDCPHEFRPERFEEASLPGGTSAGVGRKKYTYVPFGAGARACIGAQFATLEAVAIIAMTIRRFDFRSVQSEDQVLGSIKLDHLITLKPKNGFPVEAQWRRS